MNSHEADLSIAPRSVWHELRVLQDRAGLAHLLSSPIVGPLEDEWYDAGVLGRSEVRDAYFGVGDIALRRMLIEKHLEYWRAAIRYYEDEAARAAIALDRAIGRGTWITAVAVAAIALTAGAYAFGVGGAALCAIVGAPIGWAIRRNAIAMREQEIAACRELLEESQLEVEAIYRAVPDFTDSECVTGMRDPSADAMNDSPQTCSDGTG
jgi:hypothetical protein